MYGVSGIPHTEWNGHDSHVGGASGGNWESLYPGYLELVQGFSIQETPWRIGISGEYEPGAENVSFAVEVLIDNIDSTVNIDNLYLEIFVVEDEARKLIYDKVPASVLRKAAREMGMKTLREDGARKVTSGLGSERHFGVRMSMKEKERGCGGAEGTKWWKDRSSHGSGR